MITTNVPVPTFGPVGFIIPAESDILAGTCADIQAAFGGQLNLNPLVSSTLTTSQGQFASSEAAVIGDCNATFLYFTTQLDPAFAQGRMQDAIGRIYLQTRYPALATTVQGVCSGKDGVVIPVGALVPDNAGNLYAATNSGTIAGGTLDLSFACVTLGPIACPAAALGPLPYQSLPGWDSVTNPDAGVTGRAVETRAAFEARRQFTLSSNGQGFLDAILGNVYQLPGILSAVARENPTGVPVVMQGVTLSAHSLYIAAWGGVAADIAQAIWVKKDPGCAYNGNTTIDVLDTNPAYVEPFPSYPVAFEIPTPAATAFTVTLGNGSDVPANAQLLVAEAIASGFSGADGGAPAGIGATIYASRYIGDIAALGPWVRIVSVQVGTNAQPAAGFTASIAASTNVLTVTAVASGTLAAGQNVYGPDIAAGTSIVSQIGGTTGGIGTYALSLGYGLVASQAMTSVASVNNVVTLDLDQMPVLSLADVNLVLV